MKRVEQREEAVIKLYQLKVKSDIEKSSSSYTDMLITGVLENKDEFAKLPELRGATRYSEPVTTRAIASPPAMRLLKRCFLI